MKKILILASIGCQNLGDELILKNEMQLLQEEFGTNTQFRVCSYDMQEDFLKDRNIKYQEYFPIDAKKVKNIPRNIKNAGMFFRSVLWSDIVVIGGGGIFYETENQSVENPLRWWKWRAQKIQQLGKKIYFYALGIDIVSETGLKDLQQICSGAYKISVRDEHSQNTLQNLEIPSELVYDPVMYDAGVSYNPGSILGAHLSKEFTMEDVQQYDYAGKKIGIAFRSGYLGKSGNEKIEKLLVEEICSYIESQRGEIVFLPHSFHKTDIKANDFIYLESFLTREREIARSMQEVYSIYQNQSVDMILTMRLHSMILSHVYAIDQIALCYGTKTIEFIKKISS